MTVVMRVFVEAMPHVPAHRRIMLCKKLVSVLGIDRYLWRLIMLFLERVTVSPVRSATAESTDDIDMEEEKVNFTKTLFVMNFELAFIKYPNLFPNEDIVLWYPGR